ncbi:MAG: hypothetical protein ABJ275_00055 [Maricaulaceae bacterium]
MKDNMVEMANKSVVASLKSLVVSACALSLSCVAAASVLDRPFFRANATVVVIGAGDFNDNGGVAPVVFDFLHLENGVSGTAATDLIGLDGRPVNLNSGLFNPIFSEDAGGNEFQINDAVSGGEFNSTGPNQILNATDSYNAFVLDEDTDVGLENLGTRASRFFVASNSAFDIYAHANNLETTGTFDALDLSNIRFRLRYQVTGGGATNRWGERAQDPAIGGAGIIFPQTTAIRLDAISSGPTQVFDGGRRTAAEPGSLLEQAVGFQARYNLLGDDNTATNYDLSLGSGSIAADVTYTVYVP